MQPGEIRLIVRNPQGGFTPHSRVMTSLSPARGYCMYKERHRFSHETAKA